MPNPALSTPSPWLCRLFCCDLIARSPHVSCFGHTSPSDAALIFYINTSVWNCNSHSVVLLWLSRVEEVRCILQEGVSIGRSFFPRGLTRKSPEVLTRLILLSFRNSCQSCSTIINTDLNGCETVPQTVYVKDMPVCSRPRRLQTGDAFRLAAQTNRLASTQVDSTLWWLLNELF